MADTQLKDDFTQAEAVENGVSGKLSLVDGYNRVAFTETTRVAVEQTFAQLIDTTVTDYKRLDTKREKNLKAHEALPEQGQAIVIPIAKRDTNQQLAWILNTLLKDPLITVRPLEAGHVQIVAQNDMGQPVLQMVTTEDEARDIGLLVNYYLRDRVGFKKTVKTWVAELLRDGNRPPILKVLHEERMRQVMSMGIEEGETYHDPETKEEFTFARILETPQLKQVRDGEPTRIECIPGERFFVPFPEYDIQSAPFVFQEFEEDSATIKSKIAEGKYDFCGAEADDEAIELVLSGLVNLEEAKRARLDGRTPSDPLKRHKLYELWFYYPFSEGVDAQGKPQYQMRSFCSVYHAASRRLLSCYENTYWHGMRPFHAGFMQQRPFSFTGYSTTENVAPFQRLISQLFHLQIQNVVQANVQMFFARKTSSTFKFLNGRKLRPGLVVPFDEPDDIQPRPLGTQIGSMSAEISFLNGESEKMSVVTQYDRGNIPSRTPAATISAVENLAKMQPTMVLDSIRETISDVVKMFVQTLVQYSPEGIVIPFEEPTTKAVIQKFVHFPRQMIVDQFAFDVTATADDDTPEARFTKDLQISGQISAFNQELMGIGSAIWKPEVPPPIIFMGTYLILGKRRSVAQMLKDARLNPDDYLPTEAQIQAVPTQLLQLAQQAQQMAAQQQPQVKVSLSGQLTPEQEAQAAAMSIGAPQGGPQQGPPPQMPQGGPPQGMPQGMPQ